MVDVQTAYYMVAATGVIVAAIYYIYNMRISQKNQELSLRTQELALKSQQQNLETRQVQLFMQLYDRFSSNDFLNDFYLVTQGLTWTSWDDYWKKYGPENNDISTFIKIHSLGSFFEGIGVLVNRGLIEKEMVNDLMGGDIVHYWEKVMSVIQLEREMFHWPGALVWTEYLYNEIKSHQNANA